MEHSFRNYIKTLEGDVRGPERLIPVVAGLVLISVLSSVLIFYT